MSEFYKPRQAYEYDEIKQEITGRFLYIIGGEMSDGTKCWYKCNKDGEHISEGWYSIHRIAGHMIAILEAID